ARGSGPRAVVLRRSGYRSRWSAGPGTAGRFRQPGAGGTGLLGAAAGAGSRGHRAVVDVAAVVGVLAVGAGGTALAANDACQLPPHRGELPDPEDGSVHDAQLAHAPAPAWDGRDRPASRAWWADPFAGDAEPDPGGAAQRPVGGTAAGSHRPEPSPRSAVAERSAAPRRRVGRGVRGRVAHHRSASAGCRVGPAARWPLPGGGAG